MKTTMRIYIPRPEPTLRTVRRDERLATKMAKREEASEFVRLHDMLNSMGVPIIMFWTDRRIALKGLGVAFTFTKAGRFTKATRYPD